ncbi:MAG: hypothetical protein HC831_02420 [Chloroflexia bacterium]|nr:hypothetical protein [Chloroflexia bacterium]
MNNLTKLGVMLLLLSSLSVTNEISAQIHEIKKKSSNNKSSRSSNSSSSSKKKSSGSYSSSNSSESDASSSDVFGCISSFFDVAGCLFNAIESAESSKSNYSSNDYNDYHPDDYYENTTKEEELYKEPEEIKEPPKTGSPRVIHKTDPETILPDEVRIADNNNELIVNEPNAVDDPVKRKGQVSLDVRPQFDLSMHKGIDKNYVHVDYLPGLRANFDFFLIDFRYNILTEYTDDFPDSFKSWEILALVNLTAKQDYSIIVGTGLQREQFDKGISFHEYYLGTKISLKNKQDYIDVDTRFSRDYKTDEFPFFEFGGRYNVRFLNEKNFSGYFTFGVTYQNYYRSYDIWGIRGGVVVNIH